MEGVGLKRASLCLFTGHLDLGLECVGIVGARPVGADPWGRRGLLGRRPHVPRFAGIQEIDSRRLKLVDVNYDAAPPGVVEASTANRGAA